MQEEQLFELVQIYQLQQQWVRDLYILYRPIMKSDAADLYCLLVSLAPQRKEISFELLSRLLDQPPARIQQSRKILERYELICSFEDENENYCRMEIFPPKPFIDFFRNEKFKRMFYLKTGQSGAELATELCALPSRPAENMTNVSAQLTVDEIDAMWSQDKEEQMKKAIPENYDFSRIRFNFSKFYPSDRTFPLRLRTYENEVRIAQLANSYGQDEFTMKREVVHSMDEKKTKIDFDRVVRRLRAISGKKPGIAPDQISYDSSPTDFLISKQPDNATITPAEQDLIDSLTISFGFSNEVANTIIEYVLDRNDRDLHIGFARTVANNMARASVSTRAEALDYLKKREEAPASRKARQQPPVKEDVPDWYSNIPDEEISEEEFEAAMREIEEMNRKFRGGNDQ